MERQAISSSNLVEVGYDPAAETLEIAFKNGSIYQYFNVPAVMFEQLLTAGSPGGFFNSEIRGKFAEARC